MHFLTGLKLADKVSRIIKPRPTQETSRGFLLLPVAVVGLIISLHVVGIIRVGLGSMFSLPLRELGIAVLGLLLAMGAGKDKRFFGMAGGIIIVVIALQNVIVTAGFLKDNTFQTVLEQFLPRDECGAPWTERAQEIFSGIPIIGTQPTLTPTPEPPLWERLNPLAEPTPTPVPTPTPEPLQDKIRPDWWPEIDMP